MEYGGGYNNNQYATSYGAQGGAGGGGFISGGSQQSPRGEKGYGKDTLRPVTIKQILDAQPTPGTDDFKIDGSDVTQVKFIAQIRNVSAQTTNHTYKLDDGTGTIEAKEWIDQERMQDSTTPKFADSAYVKVFGHIKEFNTKRYFSAQIVRAVSDYNEISHHFLEATAVHLFFVRGKPSASDSKAGASAGTGTGQDEGYGNMNTGGVPGGLSAPAKRVFQCIRTSPQTNEGLHMHDIAMQLNMDVADVTRAGDELLTQGVIYTTVDDQTWAILDV